MMRGDQLFLCLIMTSYNITVRSLEILVFASRSTWVKDISFVVKDFNRLDHHRLNWPPPIPTLRPFFSGGGGVQHKIIQCGWKMYVFPSNLKRFNFVSQEILIEMSWTPTIKGVRGNV